MNLEIQEVAKQEENEKEQKQDFQEKGKKTNDCLSLIKAVEMVSSKSKNKEENKTTSSQTNQNRTAARYQNH